MSFLDGFAKGMQLAQQAVQMREGIAERQQQKEWQLEDRRRNNALAERQATLQTLQIDQAQLEAQRAKAEAEAEKRVQAAGRLSMETTFIQGKEGDEPTPVFMVGGQQYTDRAKAMAAMEAENTPLKIARRQSQAAQESGVFTVQQKYLQNYNATRSATEAEFKQDFSDAMRTGGVQGVIDLYNSKVKDGRQLVAQRGPNGQLLIGTYVGGKLQGDAVPYENEKQFLAEQVARYTASPDAYLDNYHKGEARREGIRQFDAQLGLQKDQLAETVRGHNLSHQAQMAGVGAQMAGVGVQREAINKPTVSILPTVTTDPASGAATTTYNAGIVDPRAAPGKEVRFLPLGTAPGMRNPPKPDPLSGLLPKPGGASGAGAAKQPGLQLDENGLARLDQLMNK